MMGKVAETVGAAEQTCRLEQLSGDSHRSLCSLRREPVMKRTTLVGRSPGPETLVVLVGTFRSAANWAAGRGLHLEQWTLIESCSPLTVYQRRFGRSLREQPVMTNPAAVIARLPVPCGGVWRRLRKPK